MAETLPARGTISFENALTKAGAAIISTTSERPAFKARNLLSPLRSRRYRSTSSGIVQKIRINTGTPIIPTVFALGDCNLTPGATVTLRSDVNSGMTTTPYTWSFTVYAQSPRATYRRFLGPADSGAGAAAYPTGVSARQFWELELAAGSTSAAYHEIGVWWLGTYAELPLDEGLERTVIDPSLVFLSDGQAAYFDRRPTYQEVEDSASFMTDAEAAVFEDAADRLGRSNHVLLDLWSQRNDDSARARGCYYGILGRSEETLSLSREVELRDSISWSFVETRG